MKNFFLPFLCWITIKTLPPLIAADEHTPGLSTSITNSPNKAQTNESVIEDLSAISGKTLQDAPAQTTSTTPQNNGFFLFWSSRMGFQHIFSILHRTCVFLGITKPPRQITHEQSEPSTDLTPLATIPGQAITNTQKSDRTLADTTTTPTQNFTSPNGYSDEINTQTTNPFIDLYRLFAQSCRPKKD